jgi:hypothetical protein
LGIAIFFVVLLFWIPIAKANHNIGSVPLVAVFAFGAGILVADRPRRIFINQLINKYGEGDVWDAKKVAAERVRRNSAA